MEDDPLDVELQISEDKEKDSNEQSIVIEDPIINGSCMIDVSAEFLFLSTQTFENREDIVTVVRNIALKQGYVLVIQRSKRVGFQQHYVCLGCDRGCCYQTNSTIEVKKKNSSSRRIDFPFKIVGRRSGDGLWKVEIDNLLHNHESSSDIAGHPYCRRFTKEEETQLRATSNVGIKPCQVLSSLRQKNPKLLVVSRNVYNKKAQFINEILGGRSIIRALLDELGGSGFFHNVKYDDSCHLMHLFFAYPTSIELTKSYSDVFVMDCTYKTNKYKMPLLEIIGVSSFNTSFYSCFVFVQKEEQQDYQWTLEMFRLLLGDGIHPRVIVTDRELALIKAIEHVFQWLLIFCVSGILRKISLHITQYKEYTSILTYIENTWLPWKERFVYAWTGEVSHFGNNVTSRAEGAYSTLKNYLQVSIGGLREVKENICLAIQNQFQEIKTQLASEKIRIPQKLCIPFFKEVITKVSFYALFELHKQYLLAHTVDYSSQCKGHFPKTMGLPCVHTIREMNIEVLPLNMIHKQWRIESRLFSGDHRTSLYHDDLFNNMLSELKEKYERQPLEQKEDTLRQLYQILGESCSLVLEPTLQPHKCRPIGSYKRRENSSTRREPSHFEIVEKTPQKCSGCGNVGHYRNKCPLVCKSAVIGNTLT